MFLLFVLYTQVYLGLNALFYLLFSFYSEHWRYIYLGLYDLDVFTHQKPCDKDLRILLDYQPKNETFVQKTSGYIPVGVLFWNPNLP